MTATQRFEKTINYQFKNKKLLAQSLEHSGVKKGKHSPFERLEFLGDRVLGLVIADDIYQRFKNKTEGELAKIHSKLVSRENCHEIALSITLKDYLITRQHENLTSSSILANAVEAVLGAIYIDGGYTACHEVILHLWSDMLDTADSLTESPKVLLQEWCQKKYKAPPSFELIDRSGSEHNPFFTIGVLVPDHELVVGEGKTHKEAEKNACKIFLNQIKNSSKK